MTRVNRPVVLPAAGPNGPTGFTIVKFGAFNPASTTAEAPAEATPYLFFMMFFFKVNGLVVGQTLNFFAVRLAQPTHRVPKTGIQSD